MPISGYKNAVKLLDKSVEHALHSRKIVDEVKPDVLYYLETLSRYRKDEKENFKIGYIRGINYQSFRCEIVVASTTPCWSTWRTPEDKKHWESIKFICIKSIRPLAIEELPLFLHAEYKSHVFTNLLKGE